MVVTASVSSVIIIYLVSKARARAMAYGLCVTRQLKEPISSFCKSSVSVHYV